MYNGYRPYRRGIRFFPHIVPIAFPLIFPFGFGLAWFVFHALFTLLGILLIAALVVFVFRAITLGNSQAAWNSMKNSGNQWQQRFTNQNQQSQQPPYYQPPQPQQTYGQGYQPQQSQQPSYPTYTPPAERTEEYNQAQYPEQMPPQQ